MEARAWIRDHSTPLGAAAIATGVVLLLVLRFLASPVARSIAGAAPAGLVEFLGIPLFFLLTAAGVALFLWEPVGR